MWKTKGEQEKSNILFMVQGFQPPQYGTYRQKTIDRKKCLKIAFDFSFSFSSVFDSNKLVHTEYYFRPINCMVSLANVV